MKHKQKGIWGLLCILLLLFPPQSNTYASEDPEGDVFVNGSFKDTQLASALANLSDQTGYKFVIPEEWSEVRISGHFVQEDLHRFFKRSLKKSNFSLIIDEENKTVIVKDLGGGSKIQETVETTMVVEVLYPESGMLKKDLQDLHNTQMMEIAQQKENINGIDPMSNLTNSHLKELHRQQYGESERRIEDGSAVDPMSGMPLSELKRLHEQQLADFNK